MEDAEGWEAMRDIPDDITDDVMVMASIGHVCLQWARLEMLLLSVIAAIESAPMSKVEVMFGGLDIIPRVNMALNLGRDLGLPHSYIKRIDNVRKAIQQDLSERRNLVVHGAHQDMQDGSTTLTMVRWRGDKRKQVLTAVDIHLLASAICDLGNLVWAIMEDIHAWHLRKHSPKNRLRQLT